VKEEDLAKKERASADRARAPYDYGVKKPGEAIAHLLDSAALKLAEKRTGEKETKNGGVPEHGSLTDELRKTGIKFFLDNMFDKPGTQKTDKVARPKAERFDSNFAHDHEFHGNAALEKGSVAAFSQSRRSAAQNQLVALQREAVQKADQMARTLINIEKNTTNVNGSDVSLLIG
jgi:hypothetical protein